MRLSDWWISGLVALVMMTFAAGQVTLAAIPSVTPPNIDDNLPGFHAAAPVPSGTGPSYFKVPPYWATSTTTSISTDVTQNLAWTIVTSGTALQLRAQARKGDADFIYTPRLNIDAQVGSATPVSFLGNWTGDASTTARASQFGLSYLTSSGFVGEPNIDNIVYGLTAPNVTVPTWYTFQIGVQLNFFLGWFGSGGYFYGSPVRLLVVPRNYSPQLTATARVLFAGQASVVGIPNLDPSIVPDYYFGDQPTGQFMSTGNQARVVADGTVGTTAVSARTVFAPMFNGQAALDLKTPALPIYSGDLAGEDVPEGDSATFTIRLPAGLTTANTHWYLNGILQSGQTGSSLTLNDVTDTGTVYAVTDVKQGATTIATSVRTNDATLNLIPVRSDYRLQFSVPFVYAKVGEISSLGRTDQLQAQVADLPADASAITWRALIPDTRQPSDLVQIDQTGQVTATGQTGEVDIVAEFRLGDTLERSVRRLHVVSLPARQSTAGDALALGAPDNLPSFPTGTTVSYEWHLANTGQSVSGTPAAVTPAASYQLAKVTSVNDGNAYQLIMRITTNGEVQEVISNVADITVDPPPGLALQAVPSFNFAKRAGLTFQAPTVAAVIAGAGTLENANTGSRQLIVSDNTDGEAVPWQLSVQMDQFQSISTGTPLTTSPRQAVMQLTLDGTGDPPFDVAAGGPPVVLRTDTLPVAAWNTTGALTLAPITAPLSGGYGTQIHWTLGAAPIAAAP